MRVGDGKGVADADGVDVGWGVRVGDGKGVADTDSVDDIVGGVGVGWGMRVGDGKGVADTDSVGNIGGGVGVCSKGDGSLSEHASTASKGRIIRRWVIFTIAPE